jgi:MFS family permease
MLATSVNEHIDYAFLVMHMTWRKPLSGPGNDQGAIFTMTQKIEFNLRLCEMSDSDLDLTQRNLVMAFLPYLGSPLSGSDVSRQAFKLIGTALASLQGPLGPWELAWGPGVFQVVSGAVAANTMFVARHQQTRELFISIAGTNPFSAYAWLAEDFDVDRSRGWGYGKAPAGAATSKATLTGLRALQGMVPESGIPGQNRTLAQFLREELDRGDGPVAITVSGHSLGGALSPTLALWLLDTRKEWDLRARAAISVYAYAGPTPGNDDFASYIDRRFGDRLHRIFNPLDVVTHAWHVAELAELKALYTPAIPRDELWDKAVDFLIATTNGINYRQIDRRAIPLDGRIKEELVSRWLPPVVNLVGQVLYQHTLAYFELLGLAYPEQRSVLGRRLARQTDAIASELLQRAGVWAPLSRVLGAGLRLFTEAYSRTPLMPSPVPETGAPATHGTQ